MKTMIIYKVTNLCNGKIYIGQSKKDSPKYFGSGKLITKALKKYGKSNFIKEIIEKVNSIDELDSREIHWINYFKNAGYSLYNIHKGGSGFCQEILCEYWKQKRIEDTNKIKNHMITIESSEIKIDNIVSIKSKPSALLIKSIDPIMSAISKKVYQFSMDGILLNSFESLEHAYQSLNNATSKGNLSSACNGKRNSCGGYRWSYSESCNQLLLKKKGRPLGKKDSVDRIVNHKTSSSYTILQYEGDLCVYEWESAQHASNILNISKLSLLRAVKNNTEYKGFIWKKGISYTKIKYLDSNKIILKITNPDGKNN